MTYPFLVPKGEYSSETTVNRSKFISTIRRIRSLSEMRQFYNELRTLHPKANHNCWAAVAGSPEDSTRYGFSDDGEPSGTAGKPILKVLQHSGKGRLGVIVTRYFGGIKLGTGGLVRAYTQATKTVLEHADFIRFSSTTSLTCSFPYELESSFRYILEQHEVTQAHYTYTEKVTVELVIDETAVALLKQRLGQQSGSILFIEQTG